MNVKKEIIENLKKAVEEVIPQTEINIELQEPKTEAHGDYTSNIAMASFPVVIARKRSDRGNLPERRSLGFARDDKKEARDDRDSEFSTPLELAQEIVKIFNFQLSTFNFLDRVEAIAPGFINFYLSKQYLIDQLLEWTILQGQALQPREKGYFLQGQALQARKIMVEFTDPNPFKEFHIGHLYSNTVGEAICRLLESQGAEVRRVCYQGDVGLHVAKCLWGILQSSKFKVQSSKFDNEPLKQRVKLLGQAYAVGAKAYEEDEAAKEEINQLNKKIYEQDASIIDVYKKGRQWSLDYFETIYSRLGTKFSGYYFESAAGEVGIELVKKHLADKIFKESLGAIIFEGEKYGLHNRVFINSLGLPTYEAKELGLALTKYQDYPYDQSIIVTGNEINAYFEVLLKALSLIKPDLAVKTKHIGHGMVRLPTGKMSSRTGDVITGEWLLDEVKHRIEKEYKDMNKETAEMVAVGAVKYALLKSGIGRDISFTFEESISLEGNSGPYLQYTYARTRSVARKSQINTKYEIPNTKYQLESEEMAILRTIYKFPEVVQEAADKFAPHLICNYLFDLAQKFNLFYQKHKIIGEIGEVRAVGDFRLDLTAATGQVLKTGLYLLGIQVPERM